MVWRARGRHTIKNVMTGDHAIILTKRPTPYPPQFLHVSTDTQQKAQMHAQSTNVRPSLTTDPKHSQFTLIIEFEEFTFVNSANSQLPFHCADEGRTLEEGSREIFDGARE